MSSVILIVCIVFSFAVGYTTAKAENSEIQKHFDLLRTKLASRSDARICADCNAVFLTQCKLLIFLCEACRDKDPCTLGASERVESHE